MERLFAALAASSLLSATGAAGAQQEPAPAATSGEGVGFEAPVEVQVAIEPAPAPVAVEPAPTPVAMPEPPPPAPPPVRHRRYGEGGAGARGLRFTAGRAWTEDLEPGFFGRLESEVLSAGARHGASGVGGITVGMAGWGSPDGGGGSLPFTLWGGYHSPRLTTVAGFGWDFLLYDRIRDRGSFGMFAPIGTAAIGLDLASVRVLADARAQYRWNWGDRDRWQITVGLSIAVYEFMP